jgi:poly(A) polymerase/tRNA nucleotidyltransferase (CCA-adding enzyme)
VRTVIANHMFHYDAGWTDGAVRRLVRKVGPERLADLWAMRRADARGRGLGLRDELRRLAALEERVQAVLSAQVAIKVTDLAIGGQRVMQVLGIGPGPAVGRALEQLLERVLDDPSLNEPATLEELLRSGAASTDN